MDMAKQIRNVALVAHVDHGKTTLVDALLRATGTFAAHQAVVDRVMDSNDQERERGITILAKAASVTYKDTKINLVDTPGHADFGGEVERALTMVDGILLLVDAAEGPLPQTRYVLQKALSLNLPAIVVINKVDRGDARAEEVLDEVYQLFIDLEADDHHIDFSVISAVAREGRTMVGLGMPAQDADLSALLDTIIERIPAPTGDPDAPLQALVTNLDASEYLGRLAIGRVYQGVLRKGEMVALLEEEFAEGQPPLKRRLSQLMAYMGVGRVEVDELRAGDLFVVAGFPEVEIGDTIASTDNPVALPRLTVDEPVLRMTFGVNTSPFAGRDGKYLTSRHLIDRLHKEVLGNVSIKLHETDSADVMEVAGRGELQLAVLIEGMRREGFELQVSRPEVITKEVNGKKFEPLERGVCDVPDEYVGAVTQALAPRKGRVTDLRSGDPGRSVITFECPSRGLIGFRSLLMTATRGTAMLHQNHAGWMPWCGELPHRLGGAMIADREGMVTAYALDNLQLRGELFVEPGEKTYEGMVVGESSRGDEMVVNAVRAKEKNNIRTHSHDDGVKLAAPKIHTLETAIEWIADDELVEITPKAIRVRKRYLNPEDRKKAFKKSN
ncbi:MAG: translational GTPase TypA [Actinobacteria bacterium]|nr:translational GTPase TypA [Actinomycetota bacterium]MSZ99681.1 translational GTPase TypA [Actinomycetota bacterium]MTA09841.1 translational GTPase TypA [Actinomycetota bacterium]MTA69183.1 translational GTPase TypA [Actinomycetota bacterium]